MSSPTNFWTTRANQIGIQRGINPSSPGQEKKASEPTSAEASATKKFGNGLVFKAQKEARAKSSAYISATFGSASTASPVTPGSATSWADSVEEEEVQAATAAHLTSQKCQECDKLAETITQKSKRLEEMKTTTTRQKQRIVELESIVKDKTHRIKNLECAFQEKVERITELEIEYRDQKAGTVDFTGQAGEEARRAVPLGEELQTKTPLSRETELQAAESAGIYTSDSPTKIGGAIEEKSVRQLEPEDVPLPTASADLHALESEDTFAGAVEAIAETPITQNDVLSPKKEFPVLSPVDFPALGSPGPVRDLARSPFVTADSIKKVPPPPPAKKLTLGIDPSKFKKKQEGTSGRKLLFGSRRAKEGPPVIDPTKDIRRMSKEEREPFGYGPTVKIVMGNETVATLPKYIFMQVSPRAFKYWSENPTAQTIYFNAASMTKDALNAQLEWITSHAHCSRVFSVTLNHEQTDRCNLELVRAARVLGIHSMYMGHFTRMFCQKVRDGPSEELVSLIEELAYEGTDPIFDCLANNMALQHSKAQPKKVNEWNQRLARLPKLATKMQEIQVRKNFALGKTSGEGKRVSPATKAAEEVVATTVVANSDPNAAWRATGPAYT